MQWLMCLLGQTWSQRSPWSGRARRRAGECPRLPRCRTTAGVPGVPAQSRPLLALLASHLLQVSPPGRTLLLQLPGAVRGRRVALTWPNAAVAVRSLLAVAEQGTGPRVLDGPDRAEEAERLPQGTEGWLGRPVGTGVGHSEGPGAPAPPGPLLSPSQPQPTGTRTGPWGPPLKACPPAGFPTLGCALCSHIGPECGIGKAHLPAPKPLSSHLQNGPQGNLAVGVVKTPGQTRRAAFSARPLRGLTHRPGEGGWGDGRRAAPQASHHPPSPGYAGQGRAGRRARTRWREGWYLAYRGEGVCGGWASRASAPCPPTSRRERPVATVPQERRVPTGCR